MLSFDAALGVGEVFKGLPIDSHLGLSITNIFAAIRNAGKSMAFNVSEVEPVLVNQRNILVVDEVVVGSEASKGKPIAKDRRSKSRGIVLSLCLRSFCVQPTGDLKSVLEERNV